MVSAVLMLQDPFWSIFDAFRVHAVPDLPINSPISPSDILNDTSMLNLSARPIVIWNTTLVALDPLMILVFYWIDQGKIYNEREAGGQMVRRGGETVPQTIYVSHKHRECNYS